MNPAEITTPITQDEWVKRYWFNTLQMVEVQNPSWFVASGPESADKPVTKDYVFMVELRHYMIKAGESERFPGVIANVYLDQMSKLLAQNDGNLGMMSDPNLKRRYYDKLIINVESLVAEHNQGPAWMANIPEASKVEVKDEVAPWDDSMERAREVAPSAPPAPIVETPEAPKREPKNREFELEGIKYRLIVAKDGREMYYKGGKLSSSAEFLRAASLL